MANSAARANRSDLDVWLEKVDALGQLKRITVEVDSDLETSTLTYLVGREQGSPALLFENIKGHPGHRAIYNMLCRRRYVLTMSIHWSILCSWTSCMS